MIRAIYRNGQIQPIDMLPANWHEGDRLVVRQDEASPTEKDLDQWAADVEAAAANISDEDHEKFMAAIAEHRAEAKRWMRREMGLPE